MVAVGGDGGGHAQVGHVNQLRLGLNLVAVSAVVAHHDVVGVERLRQLERAGARGLKTLGKAEVIEGIHAVGAGHGGESGRGKAGAQQVGGSFANPFEAGLAGTVVERQNQQDAAVIGEGLDRVGSGLGTGASSCNKSRKNRNTGCSGIPESSRQTKDEGSKHNREIIGVQG